jgi:hypothetical protein
LLPLLRSDKLRVDEAELVQAARNWARVGAVSGAWGSARALKAERAARSSKASGGTNAPQLAPAQTWRSQAVLERPVAEVAAPVVRELRLALLAPAELSALEEQNRREPLIPVRTRGNQAQTHSSAWGQSRGPRSCLGSSERESIVGLRGNWRSLP